MAYSGYLTFRYLCHFAFIPKYSSSILTWQTTFYRTNCDKPVDYSSCVLIVSAWCSSPVFPHYAGSTQTDLPKGSNPRPLDDVATRLLEGHSFGKEIVVFLIAVYCILLLQSHIFKWDTVFSANSRKENYIVFHIDRRVCKQRTSFHCQQRVYNTSLLVQRFLLYTSANCWYNKRWHFFAFLVWVLKMTFSESECQRRLRYIEFGNLYI